MERFGRVDAAEREIDDALPTVYYELVHTLRHNALRAIQLARQQIRWKPGKDVQHLAKRVRLGHLPPGSTVIDYERVIQAVITDPHATVYVYTFEDTVYPAIVADVAGTLWLVMLDLQDRMETAFPPTDSARYLANPQFTRLGPLKELES